MIKKEEIFVNEVHWKNMGVIDTELFALKIFDYYRQEGFPYYSTDMEFRQKEFDKLMKYDRSSLLVDGVIKQTMHGLGLAWSYFPHSFDVQCGNKITPYGAFNNAPFGSRTATALGGPAAAGICMLMSTGRSKLGDNSIR